MANTNKKQTSLPLTKHLLFSCAASGGAELATLPFDTIKVAIQSAQGRQPQKMTSFGTATNIWNNYGLRGFYGAWAPSVLRQTTYTGLRLGSYAYLKDKYPTNNVLGKMAIGGSCGLLGNLTAMPFDVVKTKIQSGEGNVGGRVGLVNTSRNIYKSEGVRGFYRGLGQTAQRSMIISGIQLPLYFTLQDELAKFNYLADNTLARTTAASIGTTLAVSSAVYPVDMCKSIVMSQSTKNPNLGTGKILSNLLRTQGVTSLYRGISMGLTRAIPHFFLTTLSYEYLKKLF